MDFWLAFPDSYNNTINATAKQLLVTSLNSAAGTAQIPGLSISVPFSVPAGGMTVVTLPLTASVTQLDGVSQQGIHLTATNNVAVFGLNYIPAATDGYLALPTDALGVTYMVSTYQVDDLDTSPTVDNGYSLFTIVGAVDSTSVTITPSVTVGSRTAGIPYVITLNSGDTYQLAATNMGDDLSGSTIASSNPVAVYGANVAAYMPTSVYQAANSLVEQLWPLCDWGLTFFTAPLATRSNGDTIKITASANNTNVFLNGTQVAVLNQGQVYQQEVIVASQITSNNPIYVVQYSNSSTFDNNTNADPSMMSIPPVNDFDTGYLVAAPVTGGAITTPFSSYENIVAPSAVVGSIYLDGTLIPTTVFSAIGSSGYYSAVVPVPPGPHQLTGDGVTRFGVVAYGFGLYNPPANPGYDAYSYPGGLVLCSNLPTPTPTPTRTPTSTPTVTVTPTITLTPTPTNSPTITSTSTATPTPTDTPTPTITDTPCGYPGLTCTPTITSTSTSTPTGTPTPTVTDTPTFTSTPASTDTSTPTSTSSATSTPTNTPTATNTPIPECFYVDKNVFQSGQASVTITFCLPNAGNYSLRIYNSAGEHIKTLADGYFTPSSSSQAYPWDGKNKYGDTCASGVYLIYLVTPVEKKLARVLWMH